MSCPSVTSSLAIVIAIGLHFQTASSFEEHQDTLPELKLVSKKDIINCLTSTIKQTTHSEILASKTDGDRTHFASISDVLIHAVKSHTNMQLANTHKISNRPIQVTDSLHSNENRRHHEKEDVPKYGKLIYKGPDHSLESHKHSLRIPDASFPEIHKIRHNKMPSTIYRYFVTVNSNEQKNTKAGKMCHFKLCQVERTTVAS